MKETALICIAELKKTCELSATRTVYDNCYIEHTVGTEKSINHNSQFKLTVNFMFKLYAPEENLPAGALRRDMCIKPDPDYDNTDLAQVLRIQTMGVFWREAVLGLICDVFWEVCGEQMSKVVEDPKGNIYVEGRKRIQRPVLNKLKPRIDEILTLPTQSVHPGTTTGTAQVLDGISGFNGLSGVLMMDKIQPYVGDLGSTLLLRNLINYRKRDIEGKRLSHVDPWSGYLHVHFGKYILHQSRTIRLMLVQLSANDVSS